MARKIACVIFGVLAALGSYWLHYYLPQKEVATISGTDIKRAEGVPLRGSDSTAAAPLDVYFISVQAEGDSQPRPYTNENTGWGWPPYFKFNAADLQSLAQREIGKPVLITYYGWRNKMLNIFPHIVSIKTDFEGEPGVSWVRNGVFSAWIFLLVLIFPRYYALVKKISGSRSALPTRGAGKDAS